jgi:hypothetical protein
MADKLHVRAFDSQERRYLKNALAEAASIEAHMRTINADLKTGGKVTVALGAAKNLARDAAELVSALSSLAILHDMRFVVDDAEEATDG